jgi:hypothetical protein
MTRREEREVVRMRVTFEGSRVGAVCLADAYEQVVPIHRRSAAAQERQPLPARSQRQVGGSRR